MLVQSESKLAVIKDFLSTIYVEYEESDYVTAEDKVHYDPDFVKKILSTKNEKSIRVTADNL